jgi:hypothetical protein
MKGASFRGQRIARRLRLATVVIAIGIATMACGGGWGPLAVVRDSSTDVIQVLGGSGRLSIDDECVTLPQGGAVVTLAWRDGQTRWDSLLRQITFRGLLGDIVVADGSEIAVGGVFIATGDGSTLPVVWVAPPGTRCSNRVFLVHELRILPPGGGSGPSGNPWIVP